MSTLVWVVTATTAQNTGASGRRALVRLEALHRAIRRPRPTIPAACAAERGHWHRGAAAAFRRYASDGGCCADPELHPQ